MVWYEEYDFISNPFTIKPQEGFDDFYGQKEIVSKVNKNVEKGTMSVVFGPYGTGKTTIMKGIIDRFKGKRKVAYYNSYTSERNIDFEDILIRGGNRISTFFGIKSKDMILLLDEAHNLMKKDFENIEKYFNDGYFKSVVLVTSRVNHTFPEIVEDIVDKNKYELKMFTKDDAINMVEARLEGVDILKGAMVKKIYEASKSPRDFMMKCDESCRHAIERGSDSVEEEDLKHL